MQSLAKLSLGVMLAIAAAIALVDAAAPDIARAAAPSDERRLALVIGNSAYAVQPLDNPVNDAALMAGTLAEAGFEVTHLENLGERDFLRAIVGFGRSLRAAGEDAVGLVYYAGHAIQADGENYLVPVDAELQDRLDLEIQTVDASTVMRALETAGNRLNMVFLDACRNNPFKALTRSGSRGLAKLDAPTGTLIAYSTAPGEVAADGSGRNSPYTRALAKAIRQPGLPVEQALKQVRIDVMERTGNRQTPWESSSLTGNFYFIEKAPEPDPAARVASADPAANQTVEIEVWKSVAADGAEAGYRDYLARYPEGVFAGLARSRLEAIASRKEAAERQASRQTETAFFQTVQANETVEGYESYLAQYPNGLFATLATARIAALKRQQVAARSAPAADATPDPETVLWASVKDGTTEAELNAYLDAYPDGRYAAAAKAKIAGIKERRKIAALQPTTGANPYDGRWTVATNLRRAKVTTLAMDVCRRGRVDPVTFDVEDGKGRAVLGFNRPAEFTFTIAPSGRVDLTAHLKDWNARKFHHEVRVDGDRFTIPFDLACAGEFVFTRAQ